MNEPEMKSYVVFVERPPKADRKQIYTAMEIDHTQTDAEVELLIAKHVNEKRVNPLPAGLINFMICAADTAQEAANQARGEGLVYLSADEMKRKKADEANAEKFGRSYKADPLEVSKAKVDEAFAEADRAFDDLFGKFRDPFGKENAPRPPF